MLLSRIDRAFRRYHRTGDPQALGRVFDAAAPELYRLAWHLVGNRHAAEDLVQTTFLVAIQDAGSFADGNRVMPWLCGILTHRALHHRRQARGREGAVSSAPPAVAADPAAAAQAEELRATVAAAVRALPDPYRQVLLLHLLHELTPKEVAEALARPDATVRVQLHRGLDLLRKTLPAGVAAFARAAAPPPIGLGVVRAAVLAEAGRHGGAAAGVAITTLGGLLLMKKVLLGVAVLLVLLSAWTLWPSFEPPSRPGAAEGSAAGATVATTAVPTDTGAASPTVREEPPPANNGWAALEVLVQWFDGTPAADVTVRVLPVKSFTGPWYEAVGCENESRLRAERTDSDGIARFDALWPGKAVATADRGGRVELELAAASPNRCTLAVPRGIDVRGRVVDLDDRPIADATVWLSVASYGIESEPVAQSGSDGRFTIRSTAEKQVITATAPGFGSTKVDWVTAERTQELILRLRRAPGVLTGSVVDDAGRLLAGARVLLGVTMADSQSGAHVFMGEVIGQDLWPSRVLRTDAAGTFRAEGLPALPWPVWAGAPGLAPAQQIVDVAADRETTITLRLSRGATIRGRAVDAAGSPIAGADVHASHVRMPPAHEHISPDIKFRFSPLWARLTAQTDVRGAFVFDHVMPGVVQLSAYCKDMGSQRGELELVDAQVAEWNPVLAAPLRLHGSVVDEDGQPFHGWCVRYEALDERTKSEAVGQSPDGSFRTGPVPDGAYRLSVSPNSPLFGESRAVGEFRPGPDPIRIEIPRAAVPVSCARGRVLRQDGSAASGTVRVYGKLGGVSVQVDADGGFRSSPIPGGHYHATFASESLGSHPIGECDVPEHGDGDLGTFRVPEPGRLVVTIVDSRGTVLPDVWLHERNRDDLQDGGSLTHREGHAQGFLRPGRYLLMTAFKAPIAAMEVEVRSGETTETRFVVPDCVTFLLRVPANAPQGLRLSWRDAEGSLRNTWGLDSDAPGKDVERRAPPGRYTLEVRDADGRSATTTFDLRATDPPMFVELPLPAAK